jgi:hypothetical protein
LGVRIVLESLETADLAAETNEALVTVAETEALGAIGEVEDLGIEETEVAEEAGLVDEDDPVTEASATEVQTSEQELGWESVI